MVRMEKKDFFLKLPETAEVLTPLLLRICYLFNYFYYCCSCLKKNLNASTRPSGHPLVRGEKMSKRLGGITGSKDNASSWHLIGLPNGSDIRSTISCCTQVSIRLAPVQGLKKNQNAPRPSEHPST